MPMHLIYCNEWLNLKFKINSKCFGNKLENGFEIKEKNGKGKFENERI